MLKKIITAVIFGWSISAFAGPLTFTNKDLSVYDGDTIKTNLVVLGGLAPLSIRVDGIDTPEIKGKCQYEKDKAIEAREFAKKFVQNGVNVIPIQWDKFGGRFIAHILDKDGRSLSVELIAAGLARPYHGEKKVPWCQ